MSLERWTEVDRYVAETLVGEDDALKSAVAASDAAGLPAIQVTASQGRLLELFARMLGARTILEVGTLGGYSTIWLARGLAPGGRVITLERDPKHAEVARRNFARAGLTSSIELREGAALDLLPVLETERAGPFDLIFVDADKPSLPDYFVWSLRLSRSGTLILVDNVVREGEVVNAESVDASVQGVRRMNELIAAEPRVRATVMQTVGAKGYDGLAFVLVED
jgi:predicted O-methyltransferase YrrM